MIKQLLSYIYPIIISKKKSVVNGTLEVTWNNGELVLDSKNTNYSYGSLQRILRKGLKYIGYDRIKSYKSVLVLGVAGGSVIKTLLNEIKFSGKITGVEIDTEVINLANKYFKINELPQVEIVNQDAFEFILKTTTTYDLIIIDIFQDTKMPNFLFEEFFINKVNNHLNTNGFILFNTMVISEDDKLRNQKYKSMFGHDYSIRMYPKIEEHNEIFTIKKLR